MYCLCAAGLSAILPKIALAGPEEAAARVNEITRGFASDDDLIVLDLPEIAENGNAVKVAFDIDSPMGACFASTRMRLSKTQNIHVIAAFSDGSFSSASAKVKVTIGGCGG